MSPAAYSRSNWKIPYIQDLLTTGKNATNTPFLALTETWLKPHIEDSQVSIQGYNILRSDRATRKGGGTALYLQEDLVVSNSVAFDDNYCEVVTCSIDSIKTVIACLYRPPDASDRSFFNALTSIEKFCEDHSDDSYDLMITGDFNFPQISWEDNRMTTGGNRSQKRLLTFMEDHLLSQYVNIATRKDQNSNTENILDLFLTNSAQLIHSISSEPTRLSDHEIISIGLTYNPTCPKKSSSPSWQRHSFRRLNLNKSDYPAIIAKLDEIDWNGLSNHCLPQELPELLHLTVLQVCTLFSPEKSGSNTKPRKSDHLRERVICHRKRRKLRARLSLLIRHQPESPTIGKIKIDLSELEIRLAESIASERHMKESQALEAIKSNPRFFFSYAKQFAKSKSTIGPLLDGNGNLQDDPKIMADLLQEQYSAVFSSPLANPTFASKSSPNTLLDNIDFTTDDIEKAIDEIGERSACGDDDIPAIVLKRCKKSLSTPIFLIWKHSLDTGFIEKKYKTQLITPVYKKGSRGSPENYRPIALTSHIIKVFERVMRKRLVEHLESNGLLCDNQHGFRKGRSCLTQLLAHFDDVMCNALEGADTDAIYLDFAKAFDKVDHLLLLKKLQAFGVTGKVFEWIKSFLLDRDQYVAVNGVKSYLAKVLSGVPQGTVLGPILFIIFINDMKESITSSILRSFADDTRILKAIFSYLDVPVLQDDLNRIIQWSIDNNMSLHKNKFELLQHTYSNHNNLKELNELPFISYDNSHCYTTDKDKFISPSETVKDLGVLLSANNSWSPHIGRMVNSARRTAAWVLSVFRDRSKTTMMQLFKSLVRPKLEYCCPVWSPTKIEDIKAIESLQRTFTSKISGLQHLSYWDRLERLNMMSLQRRRERYLIIHMWKIRMNQVPNDLNIRFHYNDRLGLKALVPKSPQSHVGSTYQNSFAVKGPRLWNMLPKDFTLMDDLESFKTNLDRLLLSFKDTPPIASSEIQIPNSLLDRPGKRDNRVLSGGRLKSTLA